MLTRLVRKNSGRQGPATLFPKHIASITEMRGSHKVLGKLGAEPVAVLKKRALVVYFVPAEAISNEAHRRVRCAKSRQVESRVTQLPDRYWTI